MNSVNSINGATVANASAADAGTVQGAASIAVLKRSMDAQASSAAQLIAALPQPALATTGTLGTRVNSFA